MELGKELEKEEIKDMIKEEGKKFFIKNANKQAFAQESKKAHKTVVFLPPTALMTKVLIRH